MTQFAPQRGDLIVTGWLQENDLVQLTMTQEELDNLPEWDG